MNNKNNISKEIEFYLGTLGACLPMITVFAGIVGLLVAGYTSSKCFWAAGVLGLIVAFLLAKDKSKFNDLVVKGVTNQMFAVLLLAFFLAGILAKLLQAGGLVDGLLWVTSQLNINAGLFPLIAFLTCIVISTCTGTTGGTCTTVTPVLLPVAVSLGCDPALMMGAIVSGSFFGDNIAPVSDTTIASALTQEAEVSDVVKSRFKYSIVAAVLSAILYIVIGLNTTQSVAGAITVDSSSKISLWLLLSPAFLIFIMIRGAKLIPAMLTSILVTTVIGFVLGLFNLNTLISTDGIIVTGIEGMTSVIVFAVFIFAIVELFKASGIFEILIEWATSKCKNVRQAEAVSSFLAAIVTIATAAATVAIVMIGPVTREILKRFGVERSRGANILDGTCCAIGGITFWNLSCLLAYSLAESTGCLPSTYTMSSMVPYVFHCWFLLFVYIFAIITGWGRKYEDEEGNISKKPFIVNE